MSELAASIFVICNPEDQDEILEPLLAAGCQRIATGDGGDESLATFEEHGPDVVVLCANLDQGDARSLISAMRDGPHGEVVQIILVGEVHGPIRNALDAVDLAVDRFLGQPLSAKALVFCVRTCARAAAAARARLAAAPAVDDTEEELEIEIHAPDDDFLGMEDTAEPELGVAEPFAGSRDRARGVGDWDEPPTPTWREPTVILSDGGAEAELDSALDLALGARLPATASASGGATAGAVTARLIDDGDWADAALDLVEPPSLVDEDDLSDGRSDGLTDALTDDLADDFAVSIGDELEDDLQRALAGDSDLDAHIADLDGDPEGGGEFARALRRKMSVMAERLFPGQHAGAAASIPEPGPGPEDTPGDDVDEVPDEVLADVLDGGEVEAGPIRRGEADAVTLIERMYRQRITGRITFRRGHARKSVLFDKGRPVFASSTLAEDRLGALLYREGKISNTQHGEGYVRAIESGKRMGEMLVEMGYLKRRELLPTVRRHLEDLIYSLFAWDTGEYEIVEGGFAAGERIRISRHPAAMILEGVRRKLDQDTLMALVGSPSSVLEIVDDRQCRTVVSVADLSPIERKVIASFDGERSLADIAERSSIGLLPVYQLAYGLVALQAAQVVRLDDEAAAEDTEADGEAEDAIDRQRVLAKLALVSEADYFALLGVRRDATGFEIQRAYEAARQDYASEVFSPVVRRALADEIAEINEMLDEAYRVLRDDTLRHAYLRNLFD